MVKAFTLAVALVATFAVAEMGTASPATATSAAPVSATGYVVTLSGAPEPGTRGPVIQT